MNQDPLEWFQFRPATLADAGGPPRWRRRGLALAPLHHSLGSLYRQGKRRIVLEMDDGADRGHEDRGGVDVQSP